MDEPVLHHGPIEIPTALKPGISQTHQRFSQNCDTIIARSANPILEKLCFRVSVPRAHFLYKRVCVTVQEMREGPSEPAFRSRFQTPLSCAGKEPGW